MRASVHAPNLADAKTAISAGATALAHGVLDPFDDATIATMKSRPVFYIPTMDIFEFLADTRSFLDVVLSDPGGGGRAPARDSGPVPRARVRRAAIAERYPNFESLRGRLPILRQNLRKLHAAGVPVALGTDMWAFPGLGVSIELDLYVKAGLAPLEAIRAATQTAARSLGVEGERGTLAAGMRADFVRLGADPLADVKNTRRIRAGLEAGSARLDGAVAPEELSRASEATALSGPRPDASSRGGARRGAARGPR